MKKLFSTLIITLFTISSMAQNNRVEMALSGYQFYGVLGQDFAKFNMMGIRYIRVLNPEYHIGAAYYRTLIIGGNMTAESTLYPWDTGNVLFRNRFHYFDLSVANSLFAHGRHKISAFTGVSFAYGENTYLSKSVWIGFPPDPGSRAVYLEFENRSESYMGIIGGINYEYSLWKVRIILGAELFMRQYTREFPFQVNYSFLAGYNF